MRFADEFRDPEKARVLVAEIERLAPPLAEKRGRPLQVMEVCGGHTHTIFRYGLKNMLPSDVSSLCTGRDARSAFYRWGAWMTVWCWRASRM